MWWHTLARTCTEAALGRMCGLYTIAVSSYAACCTPCSSSQAACDACAHARRADLVNHLICHANL